MMRNRSSGTAGSSSAEWIEDEPPEGEQIAEQNKPKFTYAPGSLEWGVQQEQERLARIAAEEDKRRGD